MELLRTRRYKRGKKRRPRCPPPPEVHICPADQAASSTMSSLCWRCLSIASRPQVRRHFQEKSRTFPDIPALAFSTTPYLRATPPKKSSNVKVTPKKGVKALFLKKSKKPTENRGRRPAPGERKALRKRIVLSNVNALQVNGMQDITAENMYDGRLQGQVLGLPGPIVDQLRAVEAFKSSQGWGMFWRPGTLMRDESLEMGKLIADMSSEEGRRRKTVRTIVVGEKGSGKSMMLLQAMTMAMLKGWTVINLPEGTIILIKSPQTIIRRKLTTSPHRQPKTSPSVTPPTPPSPTPPHPPTSNQPTTPASSNKSQLQTPTSAPSPSRNPTPPLPQPYPSPFPPKSPSPGSLPSAPQTPKSPTQSSPCSSQTSSPPVVPPSSSV